MKNFKKFCKSKYFPIFNIICDIVMLLCTTSFLVFAHAEWWLNLIYIIWHSTSIATLVLDIKDYKEFKHKNEHC